MRLKPLFASLALILVPSPMWAQTPLAWQTAWSGGSLTCTTTRDLYTDESDTIYSNYIWTDPTGATHTFTGTAEVDTVHVNGKAYTTRHPLTAISDDGKWTLTSGLGTDGTLTLGVVKVPSFLVLGVVYSPPGAKGYVSMNSTSAVGSSHSTSQSFSNSVQVTEDTSVRVVIANASIEGQWTFTQEATTTQAESITVTTSATDQITGGGTGLTTTGMR